MEAIGSRYLEEMRAKVKKGDNVFIAHNATLVGDITLGNFVSVWFGAVLRADFSYISIGDHSNVQDNVVFHVDPGMPAVVGKHNIIGHGAIVHACTIGNNNLIGMRATVMTGARIGNNCIIGAHALVTEGMEVPDFSLVLGSPGKVVKKLPEEFKEKVKWGAKIYVDEAMKYLEE